MSNLKVFNPWSWLPTVWDEDTDWSMVSAQEPKINMYEEADKIMVEIKLAGWNKDQIEVSVENDELKLTGRAKEEKVDEDRKKRYYLKEISERSFTRTIRLPVEVQADKAKADFADGILKLTLPKSERVKPKRIDIQVGEMGK